MKGKMKTLHGLYKVLGRDAFLAAAKDYSDQVQNTVEATLSVMESTWYDTEKKMTEAEKMIADYNTGYLTRESAEDLLRQEKLSEAFRRTTSMLFCERCLLIVWIPRCKVRTKVMRKKF